MASENQGRSSLFEEWGRAREILNNADEHLHDLRKYGFTFVTALLTAESLLIPSQSPSSTFTPVLPENVKIAILSVTLVLIIALQLMDRNYQVLQTAAATRALVLERVLNLQLTEVISMRYNQYHVKRYVIAIYGLFVFGVVALGWVVLFPAWYLMAILLIVAFVAWGSIFKVINLSYPKGPGDWTVDRLECCIGEEIRITLTNLYTATDNKRHPDFQQRGEREAISFPPHTVLWSLRKEENKTEIGKYETKDTFVVNGGDNYVWLFQVPKEIDDADKPGHKVPVEEGIYRLHRVIPVFRYELSECFPRR